MLKKEGYTPIPVTIPWKQTTISENAEYFLKEYRKIRTRQKYILGFSFGAMIALLASTKVNPNGLILCSLSPYFKEDLAKIPTAWAASIAGQRYQDFLNLKGKDLAKNTKAKRVHLLYGTEEEKILIARVKKTFAQIPRKRKYLISVDQAEHDLGNKEYLASIHQIARRFN